MRRWLERILHLVEWGDIPPIPFAGHSISGMANPPAPHIELAYRRHGTIKDVNIGNLRVDMPEKNFSLLNVHQGCYSPRLLNTLDSWCVFLDVSHVKGFRELEEQPLYLSMPITHEDELIQRFKSLSLSCRLPGRTTHISYLGNELAYDPLDHRGADEIARLRIKVALLDLLTELLNEAGMQAGTTPRLPVTVRRALEHMESHYNQSELTLPDIARAAAISVSQLVRQFSWALDTTPMEYLRHIRIDRSSQLLHQTDLQISEIARQVGFVDPFHFSRLFRKYNGMPPSAFRRHTRKTCPPEHHSKKSVNRIMFDRMIIKENR